MKAIILTYSDVDESEKELLKNTSIFKLAINQHAEEFKPDMRICTDWLLKQLCNDFKQPVISVREKFRYNSGRVVYHNLKFKGATIISAIEWLLCNKYDEILIVGDNTVNTKEFQDNVNNYIDSLEGLGKSFNIYSYVKGNFHLPVVSITTFIGDNHG